MERCPVCRARFRGGDSCRRCQTDLETLNRIVHEADELLACAIHATGREHFSKARALALRARALRKTELGRCVAEFSLSMMKRQG